MRTPSTRDIIEFLWSYIDLPYDSDAIDTISSVFAESILQYPPDLMPGVEHALEQLNSRFLLGIVSDTGFSPGSVLRKLLDAKGITHYFSYFSFSDETGVAKPHPKAYTTILDNADVAPAESLHIGDIEATDITGAKNLGMKAIKFTGDRANFLIEDAGTKTIADAEFDNWIDVTNYIISINS
jgi:putative hydrolase of the HAD superfamily